MHLSRSTASGSGLTRNLTLLWQGQTISRLGDQAFLIAEMMLVGRATGSSFALGMVLLASFVPVLLVTPLAGALADRGSRRRILVNCDLLAATALFLAALLISRHPSGSVVTWVIALTAACKSVISCCFGPAMGALVADLTPDAQLPRVRAILGTSGTIAALLGQAVAGIAFDRLGGTRLLAIDGTSFLASGLALACLQAPALARAASSRPPPLVRSGMAGIAFVWRHPTLRRIQLVNAVFGLLGVPCFLAMPALVRAVGGEGSWLGWSFAAGGLGGLLAGAAAPCLPSRRQDLVRISCLALLACNLPYAFLAMAGAPWQVVVCTGVMGFCCAIGGAVGDGLIQSRIPRSWQGRFSAGSTVISRMLMPIGLLGGGALTDAAGPHVLYALGGVLCITLSILLILDPRYRRFLGGVA